VGVVVVVMMMIANIFGVVFVLVCVLRMKENLHELSKKTAIYVLGGNYRGLWTLLQHPTN